MALERFIRGKKDRCNHEGKAAETRRIAAANNQLQEFVIFEDPYLTKLTQVRKELSERNTSQ